MAASALSSSSPYVGGQAVVEGVMMRGATTWAVAVRRPDGGIEVKVEDAPRWGVRWSSVPLVRGVIALAESMTLGLRALTWASEKSVADEDSDDDEATPLSQGAMVATMVVALLVFAGIFIVLPAVVTKLVVHHRGGRLGFNLFEGAVRLVMFIGYLALIGLLPDVKRLFAYHGAEHKAIAAYENGVELTADQAQRFTTEHVRCGTNFMLLVLVLAIFAHTLIGRPGWVVLVVSRVLLIPVVAGLAYEVIRWAANRMDRPWVRRLMRPGLALQQLTTREPDLDQLEVAIASLRAVLTDEQLAEVEARAA